ncbi:MAG: CopD family protein [Phototrophicaceae bacterium]
MSNEILALSLFVHLTATAIWIGGLLMTMILVYPEVTRVLRDTPALYQFLSRLRRRFYPISNLSLVALIATGSFQMTANEFYNGLLTFDTTWSQVMLAKHILIIVMAIIGLGLQYGVAPSLERTSLLLENDKGQASTSLAYQALRQREVVLTWALGLMGLAILALSAWLGAL